MFTPPARFPGPRSNKREVLRGVALLRAEGSEERARVRLVATVEAAPHSALPYNLISIGDIIVSSLIHPEGPGNMHFRSTMGPGTKKKPAVMKPIRTVGHRQCSFGLAIDCLYLSSGLVHPWLMPRVSTSALRNRSRSAENILCIVILSNNTL